MNLEDMQEVLNWDFVSAMMSQSVLVITVANTLGTVFKGRLSRTTTAFIASLMLTLYAAVQGGWSWHLGRILEVLAYAVILFCLSAGTNQSVLAVAGRVGAGRGEGAGPSGAPRTAGGGWWASWY